MCSVSYAVLLSLAGGYQHFGGEDKSELTFKKKNITFLHGVGLSTHRHNLMAICNRYSVMAKIYLNSQPSGYYRFTVHV
jgi:hypothetical protein